MASKRKNSAKDTNKKNEKSDTPPPKKEVPGLLSRLFFCWMFPLFYNGNFRDLEEYDLAPAKSQYDSKRVGDILER